MPTNIITGPQDPQTEYTPTKSQRLRAALAYARKGKPVFPCKRDKSPHTEHGFKDATTDPPKIHLWWNRWPDANIGMPTGERSGMWVLDEDRQGALEEIGIELPETLVMRTPRGGRHLYFRHVEGITNSPGGLPAGIDVRGEGGYVLLPPSTTAEGSYVVEHRTEVTKTPEKLLERIREKWPRDHAPRRRRAEVPDGAAVHEGERDNTVFFACLDRKDEGWSREDTEAWALEFNEKTCIPPLPEKQVLQKVRSAFRYPIRRKARKPEVEEILQKAWREWYEELLHKGGRSKTRDCARTLLEFGERFGDFIEVIVNGEAHRAVAVSLSCRQGAIPAATSHMSFARAMRKLEEAGYVLRGTDKRQDELSETWLILAPATKCYTPSTGVIRVQDAGGVTPCRAPEKTPTFRWRHPVGNAKGGTLVAVEMYPSSTAEELAEIMGYSRVRDFKRIHLDALLERGVIVEVDGRYNVAEDYAQHMEAERHAPYHPWRRRRTSVDAGRVTKWVEYGPETSDAERDQRDQDRYEENRREFREAPRWRSAHRNDPPPDRAPTQGEMDARREHSQKLRKVRRLEGEGMAYRFAVRSVLTADPETGEVLSSEEGEAPEPEPPTDSRFDIYRNGQEDTHPLSCDCLDCAARAPSYARARWG